MHVKEFLHSNVISSFLQMCHAEVIHLACHISWKLSAIVFSPPVAAPEEFVASKSTDCGGGGGGVIGGQRGMNKYSINSDTIHEDAEEDARSEEDTIDMPALSEFLITAADILNLKLKAKLVVVSR
jgi:hypothetical protein